MRCLALAKACQQRGAHVAIASVELTAGLERRLDDEGLERIVLDANDDPQQTARQAQRLGARWVVTDGYHFRDDYHQRLRESLSAGDPSCRVGMLAIDDWGHCERFDVDVVVNQNGFARLERYQTQARLLLGPRYAMLRPEFASCSLAKADQGRVLVTLGGTDPAGLTRHVMDALAGLPLDVVCGAGNPALEAIAAGVAPPCRLHVDVRDMTPLMQGAALAVAQAGTTTYELACLRVPMLALSIDDSQHAVARWAEQQGFGIDLGWGKDFDAAAVSQLVRALLQDPARRRDMGDAGRAAVDGHGSARVAAVLLD